MGRYRRSLALALCGAGALAPQAAEAAAPRTGVIVEGRSMAGAKLRDDATRNSAGTRVLAGELATWGRLLRGFCFEGTLCAWRVTGDETVTAVVHGTSQRVQQMVTDARRWRTAAGIGPRSTVTALRRAYGRRVHRRTTCELGGFGAVVTGYVLNTRHGSERRFTFFEVPGSGQRISAVWIGRGRASPATNC